MKLGEYDDNAKVTYNTFFGTYSYYNPGNQMYLSNHLRVLLIIVNGFATASNVYVTLNGCPSVLWKTRALPVKTKDPTLIGALVMVTGVFENIVIGERAIRLVLSIHLAFKGKPCLGSGRSSGAYLCSTSTSMGLLAVNVAVPVQIFPAPVIGRATTIWCGRV